MFNVQINIIYRGLQLVMSCSVPNIKTSVAYSGLAFCGLTMFGRITSGDGTRTIGNTATTGRHL
jgi:hypothetical protein